MNQRQVPLKEATHAQLVQFARLHLQLGDVHHNMKNAAVRAKVDVAWDKPYILVEEEAAETVQEETQRKSLQQLEDSKTPIDRQPVKADRKIWKVLIAVTESPGGNEPVPVGVNGKVMLIPRGREVEIPEEYLHVLQNAVAHKFEMMPDGLSVDPVPRIVPQFPFTARAA